MLKRRLTLAGIVGALAGALAVALAAAQPLAAANPGDPCTTEGALADLGGGKIVCTAGKWQPFSGGAPGSAPGGAASAGAKSPATAAVPSSLKSAAIFTKVGVALSQETFATTGRQIVDNTAGQVADVTAVQLSDGRVRLYAFVKPAGVRSAISTDATGTVFIAEEGTRIGWAPGGQTRVYALDDGRYRLFYTDGGGIKSAISSDGLAFTDEGVRISGAQAGFEPGGISVVKTASGYRGYFSNLEKPGVRAERITRTATSPDMLTWTVGPQITGAAGSIKDGASHPFAITDGKTIALYYNGDRDTYYGTLISSSTDGITFSNERAVLQGAGDPQVLTLASKTSLLYYGYDVPGKGFGILVARTTGNPISGVSGASATTAKAAAKASTKASAKKPAKKPAAKKPAKKT